MKKINGKNPFVFVRFGGLDLKRQDGFGQDSFHAPPTTRGVYAMPKIAQELFLVGSIDKTQPGIFPKELVDRKPYYRRIRKEFTKTSGTIWHHLEEHVNKKEIISQHNSWVKTNIKTWAEAFSKMSVIFRYGRYKYDGKVQEQYIMSKITGVFSKDFCEVFFDEKI